MENRRNYYRILHIQPDAPEVLIKVSYRAMMQKLKMHPDLGGSHWNAVLVNEAYAVLSDPAKRRVYDKELLGDLSKYRFHEEEAPTNERNRQHHTLAQKEELIKHYCLFCMTPYHPGREYEHSSVCFECRSPLRSNKEMDNVEHHNRLVQRRQTEGPLTYYTYWPESPSSGKIFDLSPKGIGFYGHNKISSKSILKLESDQFRAVIEVMHCKFMPEASQLPYSIGAEFLTVNFEQPKGNFLSVDV